MDLTSVPSCYSGHCYCGGVQFEVNGATEVHKACYCHCESCRRAHSAPLYHVVYVPSSDFVIKEGKDLVKCFKKSSSCSRFFCDTCGSRLKTVYSKDYIGFFPSLLEESVQHELPIKFQPKSHFCSSETILPAEMLNDDLIRE